MEGPISFWGYKEQESNLILPEHDDDDDDNGKKNTYTLITFYCYQRYNVQNAGIYNVNIWLYSLLCSPLDVETRKGTMFNQCILSCVLMALVYIHNKTTWIQVRKQCVVFLQQIATSKYTLSRCSLTTGADKYHTKTKSTNEMSNNCFIM